MPDREALTGRSALQRYVIAWAERERAAANALAASEVMGRERVAAREALSHAGAVAGASGGAITPVVVELLGGQAFDVFADTAGIVVIPKPDEAVDG